MSETVAARLHALVIAAVIVSSSAAAPNRCIAQAALDPKPVVADSAENPDYCEMLRAFFKEPTKALRTDIAVRIAALSRHNVTLIANALRSCNLWSTVASEGKIDIETALGKSVTVLFRLPKDYDPKRQFPLLVAYSSDPTDAIKRGLEAVDGRSMIVIAPDRFLDGSLFLAPQFRGEFRSMLAGVRRVLHIDSSRVYLFGLDESADAAWHAAIANAESLAGFASIRGCPILPYSRQSAPLLLPNLSLVRVLATYAAPVDQDSTAATARTLFVAAMMALVHEHMPRDAFRLRLTASGPTHVEPADWEWLFSWQRPKWPTTEVKAAFYTAHTRTAWTTLSRRESEDPPLLDQFSMVAAEKGDADSWIREVFEQKTTRVKGELDDRGILLTTRDIDAVDVWIPADGYSKSALFRVVINSRIRKDKAAHPSILIMLEKAYDDYDFDRLVAAKQTFRIKD